MRAQCDYIPLYNSKKLHLRGTWIECSHDIYFYSLQGFQSIPEWDPTGTTRFKENSRQNTDNLNENFWNWHCILLHIIEEGETISAHFVLDLSYDCQSQYEEDDNC